MDEKLVCSQCGKGIIPDPNEISPPAIGFGIDKENKKICYECCAKQDEKFMKEHGRIALYLTFLTKKKEVTNWPGSLRIPVRYCKEGKHNMAGIRRDVWFDFDGFLWHGVQYGEHSEICYCRKTKQRLKTGATDARGFKLLCA